MLKESGGKMVFRDCWAGFLCNLWKLTLSAERAGAENIKYMKTPEIIFLPIVWQYTGGNFLASGNISDNISGNISDNISGNISVKIWCCTPQKQFFSIGWSFLAIYNSNGSFLHFLYIFPSVPEQMLRPERRLLIAEKETKGYEWADTYLEQTRRGILPR